LKYISHFNFLVDSQYPLEIGGNFLVKPVIHIHGCCYQEENKQQRKPMSAIDPALISGAFLLAIII